VMGTEVIMRRWYVFFLLVAILGAFAGLGIFSDGSLEQQTAGKAGPSKLLFLSLLAFGGLAYAGWLAYSSARKRKLGSGNDEGSAKPRKPSWQSSERSEDTLRSR
jgi:hypothetical protein